MSLTSNLDDSAQGLGTSDYSEKLIRPGANVGFFGWLALLGLPILLLFFIYTKMDSRSVIKANPSSVMSSPVQIAPATAESAANTDEPAHSKPAVMEVAPSQKAAAAEKKIAPKAVKAKAKKLMVRKTVHAHAAHKVSHHH